MLAELHTAENDWRQKTEEACRDLLGLGSALWTFVRVIGIITRKSAAESPRGRAVIRGANLSGCKIGLAINSSRECCPRHRPGPPGAWCPGLFGPLPPLII